MEIEKEYEDFGLYVKKRREDEGMSQDDLAKIMDLSRVSIANIEGGRQRVLLHQAIQLAKALKFSLGDFQADTLGKRLEGDINTQSKNIKQQLTAALEEVREEESKK